MMYPDLKHVSRILLEAELKPVQGQRIQPTGFPNLGAATYRLPTSGRSMLLVESNQSMANRMESIMWDFDCNSIIPELDGLPYIEIYNEDTQMIASSSILEAHRLASAYILDKANKNVVYDSLANISKDVNENNMPINIKDLVKVVFNFDPNSIIHGVFIAVSELAGGRYRLPRLLSAFIEASDVEPVESGGVKNDILNPKGQAAEKLGNVPFHRTEYVASKITAYFSLDLACLVSYGVSEDAFKLLYALSLWKIRKFLSSALRLRTACDLEVHDIKVKTPSYFQLPEEDELMKEIQLAIKSCANEGLFAEPAVTRVLLKSGK